MEEKVEKVKLRNYQFDNIRAFSIFLVIFGHMLESFSSSVQPVFYMIIYCFHIPLLVFMSGYFAKFDLKKIIFKLVFPLIIAQICYTCFEFILIGNFDLKYLTTPYWLLWYLLSLILWRLTIPFLNIGGGGHKIKLGIILMAFLIGLFVGLNPFVGREFSLSRTIVFYPFFLLGFYANKMDFDFKKIRKNKVVIILCSLMSIAVLTFISIFKFFPNELLYGATSFENFSSDIWLMFLFRFIAYMFAIILIFQTFIIFPNKQFKILSLISINSLWVYLLHGFVVMLVKHFKIFPNQNLSVLYTFLFSVFICISLTFICYFWKKIIKKIKATMIKKTN